MLSFYTYNIERELGRGSQSTVYMAVHQYTHKPVALKVYPRNYLADDFAYDAFEARIEKLAQIDDVSLVPIWEFGVWEKRPYLVMPLMAFGSLQDRLAKEEPLLLAEVNHILYVIGTTLDSLHKEGIIHGRLHPQSILFDDQGRPVLSGLGSYELNRPSSWQDLGIEPNYLAPEQVTDAPLVPETDVYGLAAILYHCLVGKPPYFGTASAEIVDYLCKGHNDFTLRNLGNLRKPYLYLIVFKALAWHVNKRPCTPNLLVHDYFAKTKQQMPNLILVSQNRGSADRSSLDFEVNKLSSAFDPERVPHGRRLMPQWLQFGTVAGLVSLILIIMMIIFFVYR